MLIINYIIYIVQVLNITQLSLSLMAKQHSSKMLNLVRVQKRISLTKILLNTPPK
jgi:hypothetical protein